MNRFDVTLTISGQRFVVVYSLFGSEAEARAKAEDICVEQTIEFPAELVPTGNIRHFILGRIESFDACQPGRWEARISFAVETVGTELTQLLNVMFGNFSLKTEVRVERLDFPETFLTHFKGPRFGIPGIREQLGITKRPLFCTALKPLGLSSQALAELAYTFALGGVDVIKDDHGLADQPMAPFYERVLRCSEAIDRANRQTGRTCLYAPNISAPAQQIVEKALFAKKHGAGALMVAPGLVGFDTMRYLADHDNLGLPIICHPALLGSFVSTPHNGLSHSVLFGQLMRLAGADVVIYPNYGGRFSFSQTDCRAIAAGTSINMFHIKPIFSAPGGGMNLDRIPEMLETYGPDMIFLIGGALHHMGPDLLKNCQDFVNAVTIKIGE